MKNIGVIIGSVREGRVGIKVAKWIMEKAKDEENNYNIIDLMDFNLPHYNEPFGPRSGKEYKYEATRNWSNEIKKYDGFIFVTTEYNGYITGALKDAIDFLYFEWKEKPFGIVGYGGQGAKWASEGLSLLLKRFDMTDMGSVHIHKPWDSVDKDNNIMKDYIEGDILELFTKF